MKPQFSLIEPERVPQLIIAAACLCSLIWVFLLSPPETISGRVSIGNFRLPDVCIFQNLTGLPCPGCGLTRSMTAVLHGDLSSSWTYHRLGLITLAYIILQLLTNVLFLTISNWREKLQTAGKYLNRGILFLGVLFFVNWAINLASML